MCEWHEELNFVTINKRQICIWHFIIDTMVRQMRMLDMDAVINSNSRKHMLHYNNWYQVTNSLVVPGVSHIIPGAGYISGKIDRLNGIKWWNCRHKGKSFTIPSSVFCLYCIWRLTMRNKDNMTEDIVIFVKCKHISYLRYPDVYKSK